jgi:hypothetical protein
MSRSLWPPYRHLLSRPKWPRSPSCCPRAPTSSAHALSRIERQTAQSVTRLGRCSGSVLAPLGGSTGRISCEDNPWDASSSLPFRSSPSYMVGHRKPGFERQDAHSRILRSRRSPATCATRDLRLAQRSGAHSPRLPGVEAGRRHRSTCAPSGGVVRPRWVVRFARLVDRRGRALGRAAAGAACGGISCLTWLPPTVSDGRPSWMRQRCWPSAGRARKIAWWSGGGRP